MPIAVTSYKKRESRKCFKKFQQPQKKLRWLPQRHKLSVINSTDKGIDLTKYSAENATATTDDAKKNNDKDNR